MMIHSYEKAEQGFMVDLRCDFVKHDGRLQMCQNGMDISRRLRESQMF